MEVHPEDRNYGEKKTPFPATFKDVEEHSHKKVCEYMWSDKIITGHEKKDIETKDYCYKKIKPLFPLSIKKEEKKEKGQRRKYGRPQKDQTIIIEKLIDFVNNYLEEPKIIYPFAGGLYKRKITVLRDKTVFKKVSSAIQMIP